MAVYSAGSGNQGYYAEMLKVLWISCCFFWGTVPLNRPDGKMVAGEFNILFQAVILRLFPDFYGVFLPNRKAVFHGKSILDDPERSRVLMGLFCRKWFA